MCTLVVSVKFGRNQCKSFSLFPVHKVNKFTLIIFYYVLVSGDNQSTCKKVRHYGCILFAIRTFSVAAFGFIVGWFLWYPPGRFSEHINVWCFLVTVETSML